MEIVQTANANDVLSGRGNGANRYRGNINFRRIVKGKRQMYSRSRTKDKQKIVMGVIEQITSNGGRFLSKLDKNNVRSIQNVAEAKKKVSQALRERTRNRDTTNHELSPNQHGLSPTGDQTCELQPQPEPEPDSEPDSDSDSDSDSDPEPNRFEESFNLAALRNLNDSCFDDIPSDTHDILMKSHVSIGNAVSSGLHTSNQDNGNGDLSMKDVHCETNNSEQPPDGSDHRWRTSFENNSLPLSSFTESPDIEITNEKFEDPRRLNSQSLQGGNHDAMYGNQDTLNVEMDPRTNSRSLPPMHLCKEKPISNAPDSDHSDIPPKYRRLMRCSILTYMPFDMSLTSFDNPSDFNNNQEAARDKPNRFVPRKSISALKDFFSLSRRHLFSNENEDDESDNAISMNGHGTSVNNNIASNQPEQSYPFVGHNDVNEMSYSSLFSIQHLRRVFQNEREDQSLELDDSDADFSFDDTITDNEIEHKPRGNICSDIRSMMVTFTSLSNRNLTGPIYNL